MIREAGNHHKNSSFHLLSIPKSPIFVSPKNTELAHNQLDRKKRRSLIIQKMDFRRPNHDDHGNQEMSSNRPSSSSLLSAGAAGDPSPASVSYRECLHNHAASLGSHVLDGCGEFMAGATDSFKCAACGCHRSFHRRESQSYHLFDRRNNILSPPALQKQIQSMGGMESSSEELGLATPPSKKRFRTKFTEEQKEKMMEFAERIGWKIQRQEDANMERFFAEIGISRQVFKVWMHNNNKNSIRKQC